MIIDTTCTNEGDENNQWKFDINENETVNIKSWKEIIKIQSPPPEYLVIQLKRFNNQGAKIDTTIKIDDLIELPECFDNPTNNSTTYTIQGFIIHEGSSSNSGHYYTIVKNKNGSWTKCNDSTITLLTDSKAKEILQNGYTFLLKRVDT